MTRILLSLVLFISSSLIANAQFKKGNIILGGQLSYNYNSYNQDIPNSPSYPQSDQKVNNGNITISAGKALNENTLVGINLSYLPTTSNNYYNYGVGPLQYKSNGCATGIFYRKYRPLGKEFYLFGQIAASYNWSDQSGNDSMGVKIVTGSNWGIGLNVFPGIAYRISKHFFLEISIPNLFVVQYNKTSSVVQENVVNYISYSHSDQLNISTSLSTNPLDALGIGFRLIL